MALAQGEVTPLSCACNSPTRVQGVPNNVMDPNIYLNAIVYYRLADVIKSNWPCLSRSSGRSSSLTSREIYLTPSRLKWQRAIPTCVAWSPRAPF
jgi:hypothetical protein